MDTSAEARVIASFTVVVALMFGAWTALDYLVADSGALLPQGEVGVLLVALVPFAVTAFALQSARAATAAWARMLGGATVMLGGLCCLGAMVYVLASS